MPYFCFLPILGHLFQGSGFSIVFCIFLSQAGPVVESILRSFPDYIKVKDLPHEDSTYKVNYLFIFSIETKTKEKTEKYNRKHLC